MRNEASQGNMSLGNYRNYEVSEIKHRPLFPRPSSTDDLSQLPTASKSVLSTRSRPTSATKSRPSSATKSRPSSATRCRLTTATRIRPSSASRIGFQRNFSDTISEINSEVPLSSFKSYDDLKPHVYGLKHQRQFYGSGSDLSETNANYTFYPYKLVDEDDFMSELSKEKICTGHIFTTGGDVITIPACSHERNLPSSLETLRPWVSGDTSPASDGCVPPQCIVFSPGMTVSEIEALPVIPPSHHYNDHLHPRGPIIRPPEHVKMRDGRSKKCSYNKSIRAANRRQSEDKICTDNGTVLYERYKGMRTADIIKQEISYLEDLLEGIGHSDSTWMLSCMQADITKVRDMSQQVLRRAPVRAEEKKPDIFGLRKFCEEHDEIIKRIISEYEKCSQELAQLEMEMNPDELQTVPVSS